MIQIYEIIGNLRTYWLFYIKDFTYNKGTFKKPQYHHIFLKVFKYYQKAETSGGDLSLYFVVNYQCN